MCARAWLAAYRDARVKASEQEIAKSLEGNWRAEHLVALKQALAGFDFCVSQLAECDTETRRVLEELRPRRSASLTPLYKSNTYRGVSSEAALCVT